jgi:hypothetical protein
MEKSSVSNRFQTGLFLWLVMVAVGLVCEGGEVSDPSIRGCSSLPIADTVERNDSWSASQAFLSDVAAVTMDLPPMGDAILIEIQKASFATGGGVFLIEACVENGSENAVQVGLGGIGPNIWVEQIGDILLVRSVSTIPMSSQIPNILGLSLIELGPGEKARIKYGLQLPLSWSPTNPGFYSDRQNDPFSKLICLGDIGRVQIELWYGIGESPPTFEVSEIGRFFGVAKSDTFDLQ